MATVPTPEESARAILSFLKLKDVRPDEMLMAAQVNRQISNSRRYCKLPARSRGAGHLEQEKTTDAVGQPMACSTGQRIEKMTVGEAGL